MGIIYVLVNSDFSEICTMYVQNTVGKKWMDCIINCGVGKGAHFCLYSGYVMHFVSEVAELLFKAALAASELKFSNGISRYSVIP